MFFFIKKTGLEQNIGIFPSFFYQTITNKSISTQIK